MNWEALGAIAELLGAVSVLLTLIYLAIQVRENSKIQTIALEMNFMINASEYGRAYKISRPSLGKVWGDIEKGAMEQIKELKAA